MNNAIMLDTIGKLFQMVVTMNSILHKEHQIMSVPLHIFFTSSGISPIDFVWYHFFGGGLSTWKAGMSRWVGLDWQVGEVIDGRYVRSGSAGWRDGCLLECISRLER